MEKDTEKNLKLNPGQTIDMDLQELVKEFNELMDKFVKKGYILQSFCQSGIRVVKVEKKHSLNPFKRK